MVTTLLVSISALGFFVLLVQRAALAVALRRRVPVPVRRAPISILKPLCGVDDASSDSTPLVHGDRPIVLPSDEIEQKSFL